MKLYLVSVGCYSDYHVVMIFSSTAKAEQYMRAFPKTGYGGYNDIEEMELDEYSNLLDRGLYPYRVCMTRNGDTLECEREASVMLYEFSGWNQNTFEQRLVGPWRRFAMWANDAEHAVKIANERRIMMIANEVTK